MRKKKLIIALIRDDLVCNKLVFGLNELGLNAGDYFLNLSDTIFKLMDFPDNKAVEDIYKYYLEMTKRAKHMNVSESRTQLDILAHEIYEELVMLRLKIGM